MTIEVVAFDVNDTLSDMAPMGTRFADLGVSEMTAKLWFASLLRDGFALAAAGSNASFDAIGTAMLRTLLAKALPDRDLDGAVEHIRQCFSELRLHPDVADAVTELRRRGKRLVTLTNGATAVADRLFATAGIRDHFEQLLSADGAGVWKPAAAAYLYASTRCTVPIDRVLLVAVHPWDIHGAARAGCATAWINRGGEAYPEYFSSPRYTLTTMTQLPSVGGD